MDIFGRFKKQYAHYFLGVIIPAAINGISVPLLKHFLGAEKYGQYALYFNLMLIANLFVCGWLWQGILRFTARVEDTVAFGIHTFYISLIAPVLFFVPVVLLIWYKSQSLLFAIVFAGTLLIAALQLPRQALLQASFQSKIIVKAEVVRTVSWLILVLATIGLQLSNPAFLFGSLLVSYGLSTAYLYTKNPLPVNRLGFVPIQDLKETALPMLRYGLPFSLWYVFFYLVTYIDKVFMLNHFGQTAQGNYNALFDFTAKALVLLLSPILVAATPLLAEAYETGNKDTARKLLQKLLLYEIAAMMIGIASFWLVGYQLLFTLLHIPETAAYKNMGVLIIGGTFLWQIALLVQKRFELLLQSRLLLISIMVSLAVQWLFYVCLPLQKPETIPVGFFLSAVIYLLFLLFAHRIYRKPS